MTIQTKTQLKAYFNTGDIPTETQFADLIDSLGLGWINIRDYGAVDDGITDCAAAINNAITAASAKIIYFPPGTYLVSSPIIAIKWIRIFGYMATLKATAPMAFVFGNTVEPVGYQRLVVEGLEINGNNLATNGISLVGMSILTELNRLIVRYAIGDGMVFTVCMIAEFRNLLSESNGGNGITLKGCNALKLYSVRCADNIGHGVEITKTDANHPGNCCLYGFDVEGNDGHGIYIHDVSLPFLLDGGWLESNIKDGIRIDNSIGSIIGQEIYGAYNGLDPNYAIRLVTNAQCYLSGNKVWGWPDDYSVIRDDVGISVYGLNWTRANVPLTMIKSGVVAAVTDGAEITHGMSVIPTRVNATASVAGEIVTVPVATITNAHFHVDIKKHDGTPGTAQTIYWRAEV